MARGAGRGPEQYHLADLLVDVGRQRVTRAGVDIRLPKLSFELLLALIRAAPNVVSHDELMTQVWPRLIVSPETVSQRVKLLRDALEDDPRKPHYIAGLRGRGYRLIPPVEPVAERRSPPRETPPASEAPPASRRAAVVDDRPAATPARRAIRSGRWRAAAGVTAALAAIAIAVLVLPSLRLQPGAPTQQNTVTVVGLPPRTVAVLPFENRSPEAADEFVAFGIAEGVLHKLAADRNLTLIARNSSFALASRQLSAHEIGRRLNARYLVGGSVQRAGERLRVTAQLIDASTGAHLWSLRFDRNIEDIFAIEDEISQSVARALEVSLGAEEHPFARYGTQAYLAFLQGRALMATRKEADAELAIERLSRALELAPQSAIAHAALAEAHIFLAILTGYRRTPAEQKEYLAAVRATAEPLLARALELDASLGEAYIWRAALKEMYVRMDEADEEAALEDYEKGIALSPNYVPGLEMYSEYLTDELGRDAEALSLLDRARRIDPLYPRSHYFKGMLMLLGNGSLQEAEALFLQTLEVAPDFHPAFMRLATLRALTGQFAEAVSYAERAAAIDPLAIWVRMELSMHYLDLEDPDAARQVIAELPDAPPQLWLPVCLYANDLEGAHEILRGLDPQDVLQLSQLDMSMLRAVRDRALASGELQEATKVMEAVAHKWNGTLSTGEPDPPEHYHPAEILVAAQWRKSLGEHASAEDSARAALQWMELEARKRRGRPAHEFDRKRAVALAILGRNDAAIAALERAFTAGDLHEWWYAVDHEPAFSALRNDARFAALATKARAHARMQRDILEQMREGGDVPRRAVAASGPCRTEARSARG